MLLADALYVLAKVRPTLRISCEPSRLPCEARQLHPLFDGALIPVSRHRRRKRLLHARPDSRMPTASTPLVRVPLPRRNLGRQPQSAWPAKESRDAVCRKIEGIQYRHGSGTDFRHGFQRPLHIIFCVSMTTQLYSKQAAVCSAKK